MFYSIFEEGSLRDYINQNVQDPWIGTPFEGYVFMSPKQKGTFGERFVSKYFVLKGSKVEKPKNTGHDRIIDKKSSEIKFSLATRDKKGGINEDQFIINHVSKDKDWERLVFFGINPSEDDCCFFWFCKEDFIQHLESDECVFASQQGGKSIGNDDYICTKINKLKSMPFVKSMDQW
ncbi:hypothetical protein EB001_05115 [bacterium]|nr:hypothetical protein [bacterium]